MGNTSGKRYSSFFVRCGVAADLMQLIGRKVQDDGKRVVFPDRKLYKRVRRTGRQSVGNGGAF